MGDEGLPEPDLDEMRRLLMTAQEGAGPLWEAALGIKNRLIGDGWSPESAEGLAFEWTVTMLHVLRKASLE